MPGTLAGMGLALERSGPLSLAEALAVDGMQSLMEAMVETGDISEPVDVETVIDTSYLEEAASMGCGQ